MSTPKISVVVPTYNRAQMVCECVASVLASTFRDHEVIVVDDCSPDDTGKLIKGRFGSEPRLRYVRNEVNRQLGGSRNVGAQVARGDYILFLDDDNLVDPEMLGFIVADFDSFPKAGLIAPMAVNVGGKKDGLIWTLGSDFNCWTSQPCDHLPNLPLAQFPMGQNRFPTLYSPNAFAVRREIHSEIGGFCERLPFYFDDSDYGWRIRDLGYEAWILAAAVTRHQNFLESNDCPELRNLGINNVRRSFLLGRNRLRFARRHFNLLQILSVTLVFAPLSVGYYGLVALKNRRPDIAWAYLKGTLMGILGL